MPAGKPTVVATPTEGDWAPWNITRQRRGLPPGCGKNAIFNDLIDLRVISDGLDREEIVTGRRGTLGKELMAQAKWLSDKLLSRYNLQPWIFEPTRFRPGNRFPEDLDTEGPRPIGTVNWQDILSPEGVDLNPETVEVVPRGAFRGVCRELIENTVTRRQRMAKAKERTPEYQA
ncbi:MAG: hypothetical protein GY772_00355, partial [bacterium]|nr:hypothetical protein [bacterium]